MTSVPVDPTLPDTRSRRRARFRVEAQDTATALFSARGFESVTMAEVAEALDVSERTLFRYFPTKESLLDPAHEELVAQLVTELEARPEHEPAFVAVSESLRALVGELTQDREAFTARMELVQSHPALQAHLLHRERELEEAITSVVAKRAAVEPETDLRPVLFGAVAVSAFRVAVERWLSDTTDKDLLGHIEEALDLLSAGLADL